MRPCGECRLCCKIFPLPVLDKPAGAWCRHVCTAGCAIHGPRTPEVCRQYDCYWRDHGELPELWRPDRIGIVTTEAGNVSVDDRLLPVVLFEVDSAEDHACGEVPGNVARDMLDHFVRRGMAVMIIRGLKARIEFDGARWPGISADAIEVALRYELSQDAEELKRLGVVEDDYRPLSRDEAEAACRKDRESLNR